jgi:hypothetical protein
MNSKDFQTKYTMEQYIGDGVYVNFDGYHIWLRADNNNIGLEPEVLKALFDYNLQLRKDAAEIKGNSDE